MSATFYEIAKSSNAKVTRSAQFIQPALKPFLIIFFFKFREITCTFGCVWNPIWSSSLVQVFKAKRFRQLLGNPVHVTNPIGAQAENAKTGTEKSGPWYSVVSLQRRGISLPKRKWDQESTKWLCILAVAFWALSCEEANEEGAAAKRRADEREENTSVGSRPSIPRPLLVVVGAVAEEP